jgi:hypothetical protein
MGKCIFQGLRVNRAAIEEKQLFTFAMAVRMVPDLSPRHSLVP